MEILSFIKSILDQMQDTVDSCSVVLQFAVRDNLTDNFTDKRALPSPNECYCPRRPNSDVKPLSQLVKFTSYCVPKNLTAIPVKDHRSTISSGKILNGMNAARKSYYMVHASTPIEAISD